MNNNLNFSKNMFGGQTETKIAGSFNPTTNPGGGRMSVDEIRNRQFEAENGPIKRPEPEINKTPYDRPISSAKMTGAFITNMPSRENNRVDQQMTNNSTNPRIQAMQNLNRQNW